MTEPAPPPRQGPRPLPFHLMIQLASLLCSEAALPLWRNGALRWKPQAADTDLRRAVQQEDEDRFRRALSDEGQARTQDFLAGVAAYRRHPYRRALAAMPVVWQQGSTRLIDYGVPGAGGLPLLVVPSLINRAYILDLMPRRSLLRYLRGRGLRPLLVDWGRPGEAERDFALDDYVADRLSAMLDHVLARAGRPALLGYCMGGTLALGLACLRPEALTGLLLLAAPWDFHCPNRRPAAQLDLLRPAIEEALALYHQLPADLLQILFWSQDPGAVQRKFRQFARFAGNSAAARNFVAIEDWVNDCVPLAEKVAHEVLFAWYGSNRPAQSGWRLAGRMIEVTDLALPTLLLVPRRDRIVPAEQALALARQLPNATTRMVEGGHVGMLLGAEAVTGVYRVIDKTVTALANQG